MIFAPVMRFLEREIRVAGKVDPLAYQIDRPAGAQKRLRTAATRSQGGGGRRGATLPPVLPPCFPTV